MIALFIEIQISLAKGKGETKAVSPYKFSTKKPEN